MSDQRPARAATITAVAQHAGVSVSTVSRVMNGNATVDAAIADRVRDAAAQLHYSPNPRARSLVLGRTMTVAILVPDLANPTFQTILRGVSRAAAADGYRVLVADSVETVSEEGILAVEMRRRCDAIVLCSPRMAEADLVALVPELSPVVLINRDSPQITAPVLLADYEAGIRPLADHLHALGHRRLAYVAGNPESASNSLRVAGLAAFGRAHPETDIVTLPGGVTFEHGHAAADAVIASGATGVLAFNDLVAMGLLNALAERGVSVPGDVSVTGFDDIPFARYTTPPLTTASVPTVELGEQAWRRLRALIVGETPDHDIRVKPRIEVRGSTAQVRTAKEPRP